MGTGGTTFLPAYETFCKVGTTHSNRGQDYSPGVHDFSGR